MLTAAFLSALALTSTSVDPWACDLAPSLGAGTSDEGKVDSITTLSFSCRYELFNFWSIGISPHIGLDRQMWSVYKRGSENRDISSYETQDIQYGLRIDRPLFERIKIFYSFAAGTGQGSLEKTESTASSSTSGNYGGLTQSSQSHTLGTAYALTEKLDLTLAWQRQDAKQKWKVDSNDIFAQSVGENNALTLTDGEGLNLRGQQFRTQNQRNTNSLQIGLSLSFGG